MSCKRRPWATQQKAVVNKLKLGNQLEQSWENLLLEFFEDAMRAPSSALPLMAKPFVHTSGQLMFTWSFTGVALESLTSHDKIKLGGKSLQVYQMLVETTKYFSRQLGNKPSGKKSCQLFLEMDYVSDIRHYCTNVPPKSERK